MRAIAHCAVLVLLTTACENSGSSSTTSTQAPREPVPQEKVEAQVTDGKPGPAAARPPAEPPATAVEQADLPEPSPELLDPSKANEKAPDTFKAKFATTKGEFTIEVTRAWAPNGADRFYNLVKIGFFNDVAFFRAVDRFMVQFGIHGHPKVSRQWRTANLQDDPVQQKNERGYVTFAKTGMPNSRSTQLFINYGDNSRLDEMGFAPIGKVVEGMETVDKLNKQYGEAPSAKQAQIQAQGNAFLKENFPNLDYIEDASIVP